jgi:hypothetical protein
MQDTHEIEGAKRILLDKLLRGEATSFVCEPSTAPRRLVDSPAPLSYNQEEVYLRARLAAQLAPRSRPYNETITIHRSGALDIEALERSLREILRRHEAWRTTFGSSNGKLVQYVQSELEFQLDSVDLRYLPETQRERMAVEIAQFKAQEEFSLAEGPLVRFQVVQLDEEEYRLFLAAHQIVLDGVSAYHVFLPELIALYEAFVCGKPSPLPEPNFQYSDYAQWQRETIENGESSEDFKYWRQQLSSHLAILRMPTDHPRPTVQTFNGAIQPFAIADGLSNAAKALAHTESTTLFVIYLAVFATMLSSYAGQDEVVVGTVAATRNRTEVQRLLGYFLNPVVLYICLTGNPTFREVVIRAREVVLGALSHSEMPFQLVVDAVNAENDLSRHPLYQVQFSLEPPILALPQGWNLTPMDVQGGGAKLDLYFVLDERPNGTFGRVQYNPDLFEAASMQRMVRHYQALLEATTADPNKRLFDLPHYSFRDELAPRIQT